MSAALKIAIILTALCALCHAETKVTSEKDKRTPEKSQGVPQQLQQQHLAIPQQTYQFIYPQGAAKQVASPQPSSQYSQQQLQYILQQAVLPQLQKQVSSAGPVAQQYFAPQQQQLQYIPQPPVALQGHRAAAPLATPQFVQQQAHLPQGNFAGQYYLHPSQLAQLGAQLQQGQGGHQFYFVPQHQAQQYYLPQAHAAAAHPAFYFGGAGANYQPYFGNQQYYFPQYQPQQQVIPQSGKVTAGVDSRAKDAVSYTIPFGGGQQLQQYSTLPESLVEGVRAGHASPLPQTPQRESPALTSSGKYGSKTNSERAQG